MQNAIASNQVMQLIGRFSVAPAVSVHVLYVATSHFNAATNAALSGTRFTFHAALQPLPVTPACRPEPSVGGIACVPIPASTNLRNRPTVTSYLSRRKSPTVAGEVVVPDCESPARS